MRSFEIPSAFLPIFLASLTVPGMAQSPQSKPSTTPFAMPAQMTQAQQDNFPQQLINELTQIKSAALEDEYAYRQVAHLTENIGPRPSGSVQAKAAVDYVAAELKKLGLEVQLEEVKVPHWVRGAETAELVEYAGQVEGTKQKIVLTALGGSTATAADGLTADVVVVNNFDELKALGRDQVAGKIVLFNEIFDKQKAAAGLSFVAYGEAVRYRARGSKEPRRIWERRPRWCVPSRTRTIACRTPGSVCPPEFQRELSHPRTPDLIAHLAAQGKVRMHLTLTPQKLPDATGYNVIADIKGSEHPEQIVVVSGHLDSWDLGTGAIDDARRSRGRHGSGRDRAEAASATPAHIARDRVDGRRKRRGRKPGVHEGSFAGISASTSAAIESDSGAAHPLGFDIKMATDAAELLRPALNVLQSFGATALQPSSVSAGR